MGRVLLVGRKKRGHWGAYIEGTRKPPITYQVAVLSRLCMRGGLSSQAFGPWWYCTCKSIHWQVGLSHHLFVFGFLRN